MIFDTLKKLLTQIVSPQYLSGPVGIMQMSGAAVQSGLSSLLQLLALIGINLGLLNLLPLVITDGGVLSLLLVEAITRKPIPLAVREKLSYVFMAAFLCLAIWVTFNDILRFGAVENLLK
jgi:regulator of sigma E protease